MISVDMWIWAIKKKYEFKGSGTATAFEAGVYARIRGEPYFSSNPYTRADCVRAYNSGWMEMDKALKEGEVSFFCPYCGTAVPNRGVES